MPSSDAFLDSVWRACPHLTVFHFGSVWLPSFEYLIDAYETDKCCVPPLALGMCSITGFRNLIVALEGAEPQTKIASTLRELIVRPNANPDYHQLSLAQYQFIAARLRTSQTLRYFAIGVFDEDLPQVRRMFAPLDGQIVVGHSEQLAIRSKCALLSAVDHAHDSTLALSIPMASALARHESLILANILAFSTRAVVRSIVLKPMEQNYPIRTVHLLKYRPVIGRIMYNSRR